MLRGLYSAASGMITQQRKHDAVTNNIANLNTPGFKESSAISRAFPEVLISLMNGEGGRQSMSIGRLNTGVMVEENILNFTQGVLQVTDNPGDFALSSYIQVFEEVQGEPVAIQFDNSGKALNQAGDTVFQPLAFITVMDANDQERYTSSGNFLVDATGQLVTSDGHRVMGQDGQAIQLDLDISTVRMAKNGTFFDANTGAPVVDEAGNPIALLISQIDNPHLLTREGNGVFRLNNPEDNPARPIDNLQEVEVFQGFREASNVNAAQATVDMMTALRVYEANQKVIQYYDRSLDKAVNEVGRV